MTNKTIDDLRAHLFDTLESLKKGTMDVTTAKTMADVGQTIINTAKLEVDFIKATENVNAPLPFLSVEPYPATPKPKRLTGI